jgi:Na+/proline symporter
MSTIDSYGFIAAETIGRDLVWRLRGESSEARLPFYTKIGLWVSAAFATVLALARPSVIGLWHDIGSVVTPALLLPVGTALLGRGRVAPQRTAAAMVAAFGATLVCFLVKAFPPPHRAAAYPLGIEPIFVGLGVSFAIYAVGWASGSQPATDPHITEGSEV